MPRLSKQVYENVLGSFYSKECEAEKFSEIIKISVGNFYDQFLNLNEFIYTTGAILEAEKKKFLDETNFPLTKTIENLMTNLHIKNLTENLNNLLKKKIEKNITENISPTQKLLLFSAFLANNLPSKMDTLLFRNVKRTRSRVHKVI
jgi:hypothetical protein